MRRRVRGAGARRPRLCEADYRARPLRPEESGSGHGPCGLSTPPEGCQWGASKKKRAAPYAGQTSTEMFTLLLIHLASQTASTMRQNG